VTATGDPPSAGVQPDRPQETELERSQRNFGELLQELRVAQMGVQILFAFLLSLAFNSQFQDADTFQQTTYLVALLASAAATALLIAPVAHHRVLFRQGRKPDLVRTSHRMALGGLALLLVAMASSVLLASDVVLDRPAAILVTAVTSVWFVYLWAVIPSLRRQSSNAADAADPSGDGHDGRGGVSG
jgi:Family of unknown function (DUF6328)